MHLVAEIIFIFLIVYLTGSSSESVTSVFLRHVAGCAFWQAIRVWPHSEIFAGRRARKNACWGAPQTRCTSGQIVPKSRCAAP